MQRGMSLIETADTWTKEIEMGRTFPSMLHLPLALCLVSCESRPLAEQDPTMGGRPSSEPNEVEYDIPARKIRVHPPSEWQEAPIEVPPRRSTSREQLSRSSKQMVTPRDRVRIERTRQLAKAYQESARKRSTDKFCKYVRENPAVDAWGVQFRVECLEDLRTLLLRSAGPDKIMDTRDDVEWPEWEYHDRDGF